MTVLILDPTGNHLDPSIIADPNVELSAIDPEPTGVAAIHSGTRQRSRIEADGYARFTHVVQGKTLAIRAPALLGRPIEFRGPRADEVDVLVQHRMREDHPIVVGRLVDPDHRPMPNTRFSVMCRSGSELLFLVGGITDDRGQFTTHLFEKAIGGRPQALTFGMDWDGMAPSRVVRVPVRDPLSGSMHLGDVVMPR